jgi:hypothetical protein
MAAAAQPRARRLDGRRSEESEAARARRIERRRRERHLRRLRRDLLEDVGIAIVLMSFTLIVTAGLGVVALLEIPVAAAVIASYVVERGIRRGRRRRAPPRR